MTDETDGLRHAVDQIARALFLFHFAVETQLQQQVVVVYARDNIRPTGTERVGGLRPPPLHVAPLPHASTDVVSAGDAQHVI